MQIVIERTVNLDALGLPEQARGTLYAQEEQAHKFVIHATRGGESVALSGTVSGSFIRPDGVTVPLTGAIEDGCAALVLDDQCYDVTGRFTLTVFITADGATTALYSMTGNVRQTETGTIVDPGTIIPSVANLIDQIEEAQATVPAAATQLKAAMAGDYSTSATYAVGDYAWYDGTLYRCVTAITAGESWTAAHWTAAAVGNGVNELKSQIDVSEQHIAIIDDVEFITETKSVGNWTSGSAYIYENGVVTIESATGWRRSSEIAVTEGEIYRYYASQGPTHRVRAWIVTDDSLNVIAVSPDRYTRSHERFYYTFKIPAGGTKLLLTYDNNGAVPTPKFAVWTLAEKGKYIDRGLLADLEIVDLKDCTKLGFYRSGAAYTANINDLPSDYDASAFVLFTTNPAYASENFCLQHLESISGNRWYRVINYSSSAWIVYQDWIRLPSPSDIPTNPLQGKKLSLLGDSISALAGTIPEGNAAYYNGSNHGITNANQMWWSVLCDKTGMIPCVINGWSGSGINWQTDSNHSSIVPMSDDSRCNGLHSGNDLPDVILIAGGVNDYTYAEVAQNEPLDWDGKSAPGYTEPTAGKQVYNSFTEAYAATIKKLQANYPSAIIVALSTWFTMRGTDNGYTLTHTVGSHVWTQRDYNEKIKYVAEQMHIPYIDVSNIGFNRNNFYPTYANDSATIPTHPRAAGHAVMGKAIAEKLVDLVGGFLT